MRESLKLPIEKDSSFETKMHGCNNPSHQQQLERKLKTWFPLNPNFQQVFVLGNYVFSTVQQDTTSKSILSGTKVKGPGHNVIRDRKAS